MSMLKLDECDHEMKDYAFKSFATNERASRIIVTASNQIGLDTRSMTRRSIIMGI